MVSIELKEDIARFIKTRAEKEQTDEAEILNDLLERGFEQRLKELYQQYQAGEISLGYLAEQLGVSTWRAYHLLEERGWRTANV
jgi:predicted HTH domain antitoxin